MISARTVWNILYSLGYNLYKLIYKLSLILEAKEVRLKQYEEHKDQTLEDQKNMIQSDKTSIIIGIQRSRIKVQQLASKAYEKHCIKRRQKGYMFQYQWLYKFVVHRLLSPKIKGCKNSIFSQLLTSQSLQRSLNWLATVANETCAPPRHLRDSFPYFCHSYLTPLLLQGILDLLL